MHTALRGTQIPLPSSTSEKVLINGEVYTAKEKDEDICCLKAAVTLLELSNPS